jgi:hypothetical protein
MQHSVPPPDLRIVSVTSVHPHEEHDTQRATPLIERLKEAEFFTNPPIVAPISPSQYVILDGANRCFSFQHLGYPHILTQVVSYESGLVDLLNWQHIVSEWDAQLFIDAIESLHLVNLSWTQSADAICHILFRDGRVLSLHAPVQTVHERNAVLRAVVSLYQKNAILYRTAITEPDEIWPLYPQAIALVVFPSYKPADIIAAAKYKAYLPPGISRHIIHGRALLVNYPMNILRDITTKITEKNEALNTWIQEKLTKRQVRYYAETTYQFDE